jgi:hypothetical protein
VRDNFVLTNVLLKKSSPARRVLRHGSLFAGLFDTRIKHCNVAFKDRRISYCLDASAVSW